MKRFRPEWLTRPTPAPPDAALPFALRTPSGDVLVRYYPGRVSDAGVVWVGDHGGGFDSPADDLFGEACRRLQDMGVHGLRVRYRNPTDFDGCVHDLAVGAAFLEAEGLASIGLVGHSLGAAVAIRLGAAQPSVRAVAALSTQLHGTEPVARLAGRPLLLAHGTHDDVLPDVCSRDVYARARDPKELVLFDGAGHSLLEARDELLELLCAWLPRRLGRPTAAA